MVKKDRNIRVYQDMVEFHNNSTPRKRTEFMAKDVASMLANYVRPTLLPGKPMDESSDMFFNSRVEEDYDDGLEELSIHREFFYNNRAAILTE